MMKIVQLRYRTKRNITVSSLFAVTPDNKYVPLFISEESFAEIDKDNVISEQEMDMSLLGRLIPKK